VTCSHCTKTQGGSEHTAFHQPEPKKKSWWSKIFGSKNKVGHEVADPYYFTGGDCPHGRRCRYSDSAFVSYTVSQDEWDLGTICRTTGPNNGSLTVSGSSPVLTIVGETSSLIAGGELHKIGRTTGWTYGRVSGTDLNLNVDKTDITLLHQCRVNRIAGQTQAMCDNGDSGAPVFVWNGQTVILAGIVWGGPTDGSGSYFSFSPMNQIEKELGSLKTYQSSGQWPKKCPSGQKCCGLVNPDGTCDGQCWPKDKECP
jgi:hypothetical protein